MCKCSPSRNVEVKSIWMNVSTGTNSNLIFLNLRSLRKSWSISEMAWTSWEWGLGWIFSFFNRRSFQWRRVPTVTINFPHRSNHRNHSYHRSSKYSSKPSSLLLLSPLSLSSSSSSSTSSSLLWGEIIPSILSSPRAKHARLKSLRAESARADTGRQCPHSGRGEDFLRGQLNFFTETAVTPERKVEKWFPRWEINRHAKG